MTIAAVMRLGYVEADLGDAELNDKFPPAKHTLGSRLYLRDLDQLYLRANDADGVAFWREEAEGGGSSPVATIPDPFKHPFYLRGNGTSLDLNAIMLWYETISASQGNDSVNAPIHLPSRGDPRWPLPDDFTAVYLVDKPIRLTKAYTTFGFANPGGGRIYARNPTPLISISGEFGEGPLLGPSMQTGPGQSWHMGALSGGLPEQINSWINFRDAWNTSILHGLSALAVRFAYRLDADVTNGATFIMGSSGNLGGSLLNTKSALLIQFIPSLTGNAPRVSIRTTTTTYTAVSSIAFRTGLPESDYDVFEMDFGGGFLRLFMNGALAAQIVATGTIIQEPYEGFMVGQQRPNFPELGAIALSPGAWIDGIVAFDAVLNTAAHAKPTAKYDYVWGQTRAVCHMLFSMNFEGVWGHFVKGRSVWPEDSGNGGMWLEVKNGGLSLQQIGHITLENMELRGGSIGVSARATPRLTISKCTANFVRGVGFVLQDNCYYPKFIDTVASNCFRGGIWCHSASGLGLIDNVSCLAGDYPFVLADVQMDFMIENLTVAPGQTHVLGMIKDTIGALVTNIKAYKVDDEGLDNAKWGYYAVLYLIGIARGIVESCSLYSLSMPNSAASVIIESTDVQHRERVSIKHSIVEPGDTAPAMLKFVNWTTNKKVQINGINPISTVHNIPLTLPEDADKVVIIDEDW
jgi:hypothetical protein